MNIKLTSLSIKNFKGIKTFELVLNGSNATISAANGVGKTSVYDSFFWLLFGKSSDGRKDFGMRPVDQNNKPIKKIVTSVRAVIELDGVAHTLLKEHHEKRIKKRIKGYEVKCWIDDVPKKVSEYNNWVSDIIPEDTFKLLTDLYHFNAKLHWTDRREILMNIAGEIGTPAGFDALLDALNGRSVDEYKAVLADQKKKLTEQHDGIGPRIDEVQRGLDTYAEEDTCDVKNAEKKRDMLKERLSDLEKKRLEVSASENLRMSNAQKINDLKGKLIEREAIIASDTGGYQHLLDEKKQLDIALSDAESALAEIEREITSKKQDLQGIDNAIKTERERLAGDRKEYIELRDKPLDVPEESLQGSDIADTCYACGQALPEEKVQAMINAITEKRDAELKALQDNRNKQLQSIADACKDTKARTADLESKRQPLTEEIADLEIKQGFACDAVTSAEKVKKERSEQINKEIGEKPKIDPSTDLEWQKIDREIKELESKIGKPLSEEINGIDIDMKAIRDDIEIISDTLANADRIDRDKERIKELKDEGKVIAQKIADIESELAQIADYNAEFSSLIERSVNNKFKHVTFKMFNQLLNGSTEVCCEALLNGVCYQDMSFGQQIMVGIDIVDVLAEHYGISVPLFVDGAESLT